MQTRSKASVALALAAAIVTVAAVYLAVAYAMDGPGWDLIAHYFNGRSLSDPAFYSCMLNTQCNQYNQNPGFYFESYRAPVAGFVIAFINLFVGSTATIEVYIAVLLLFYVIAIIYLSRKIEISGLLALALLVSPYLLSFTILPGSEEMVSLIFLLFAVGLLARRSPWFGLLLGLSTLGKYPTLILVPMLLLLIRPKKILYASLLFVAAVLPWLALNQLFFGNPFFSYEQSMAISHSNAGPFYLSLPAYSVLLSYAAIFAVVGLVAVYPKTMKVLKDALKFIGKASSVRALAADDRLFLYVILLVLVVLSLAATLYIGPYYDQFTQTRYGYLLADSTALLVAVCLNDIRKRTKVNLPVVAAALSLLILLYSLYTSVYAGSQFGAYSNLYKNAAAELDAHGYGDCKIITNDWIYVMWQNVSAFSQFDPNSTSARYPILEFHNYTSLTNMTKLRDTVANATPVYSSKNFSILLPQNYKCYT